MSLKRIDETTNVSEQNQAISSKTRDKNKSIKSKISIEPLNRNRRRAIDPKYYPNETRPKIILHDVVDGYSSGKEKSASKSVNEEKSTENCDISGSIVNEGTGAESSDASGPIVNDNDASINSTDTPSVPNIDAQNLRYEFAVAKRRDCNNLIYTLDEQQYYGKNKK